MAKNIAKLIFQIFRGFLLLLAGILGFFIIFLVVPASLAVMDLKGWFITNNVNETHQHLSELDVGLHEVLAVVGTGWDYVCIAGEYESPVRSAERSLGTELSVESMAFRLCKLSPLIGCNYGFVSLVKNGRITVIRNRPYEKSGAIKLAGNGGCYCAESAKFRVEHDSYRAKQSGSEQAFIVRRVKLAVEGIRSNTGRCAEAN